LVEHDITLLRDRLRGREVVDQATGQDIDELNVRVAHHEPARLAHGDGHLQPDLARAPGRQHDVFDTGHDVLHRLRAGRGQVPVVTVEPAGHCVAAEVHDAAAVPVERAENRVENDAEHRGQLLGSARRPVLGVHRLGERGEA
jgi:hypothetical protein